MKARKACCPIELDGKPEKNLIAVIDFAKHVSSNFGKDLVWKRNSWHLIGKLPVARGVPQERKSDILRFDLPAFVVDFAKAYVRLTPCVCLTALLVRVKTIGVVAEVLQAAGHASLCACTGATFDRAADKIRAKYRPSTAEGRVSQLRLLAHFFQKHGLTYYDLGDWSAQSRARSSPDRSSVEFEKESVDKLPPERFVDLIPQALVVATVPIDVIAASVLAILSSVPARLNEVLRAGEDCKVYRKLGEANYLGLRMPGSKGGRVAVKWTLPQKQQMAERAVERILQVTSSARSIKKHYDRNPTKLFLPPHLEHLRGKKRLEPVELAALLGLSFHSDISFYLRYHKFELLPAAYPGESEKTRLDFAIVEKTLLRRLPDLMKEAGGPDNHPLFLLKWKGAAALPWTTGCPCLFQRVRSDVIMRSLSGRASYGTLFHRLGLDPNSEVIATSKSLRHYLYTIVLSAGVAEDDAEAWAGLRNNFDRRTYDHRLATSSRNIDKHASAKMSECLKTEGGPKPNACSQRGSTSVPAQPKNGKSGGVQSY